MTVVQGPSARPNALILYPEASTSAFESAAHSRLLEKMHESCKLRSVLRSIGLGVKIYTIQQTVASFTKSSNVRSTSLARH